MTCSLLKKSGSIKPPPTTSKTFACGSFRRCAGARRQDTEVRRAPRLQARARREVRDGLRGTGSRQEEDIW